MSEERMTTDEAAEYLGVKRETLIKDWKRGAVKGPRFYKINHNKGYYLKGEVERFYKEHGPFRAANQRLADALAPEDFDWSWATDSEVAGLRRECSFWAKNYNLETSEVLSDACQYIAARPGYFEKQDQRFRYRRAVERACRNLMTAREKVASMEQPMSDEFWGVH